MISKSKKIALFLTIMCWLVQPLSLQAGFFERTKHMANTLVPYIHSGVKLAAAGTAFLGFASLLERMPLAPTDLSKKAFELLLFSAPAVVLSKYALAEYEKIRSNKLMLKPVTSRVTFQNIQGTVPEKLRVFIHQLRTQQTNIMDNNGFIFHGVPGTGKTMFACALAHEINAPFFVIRSSHVFKGGIQQAPENISTIFATAQAAAQEHESGRAVILFDDIDAVAPARKSDSGANPVVTALLSHLDDDIKESVIVLATTNYPHRVDDALLREGRLTPIAIPVPNEQSRQAIINNYLRLIQFPLTERSAASKQLAAMTQGKTPAALKAIVTYARDLARYRKCALTQALLVESMQQCDRHHAFNKTIAQKPSSVTPKITIRQLLKNA